MTFGGGTFGSSILGDGSEGDALSNLSFEDGTLGFAQRWDVNDFTGDSLAFAEFSGGFTYEDFESEWANDLYQFQLSGTIGALFTGALPAEDFEINWNNTPFATVLPAVASATFSGGGFYEDFDGWPDNTYVFFWIGYEFASALFSHGTDIEGFGINWNNDSYLFTFAPANITTATFYYVRARSVEDFEFVKTAQFYTAVTATDVLNTTAHGLALNYQVVLLTPSVGALPSPLAPAFNYFVQNVPDANNFKLGLTTAAGSPIDLTTTGSGLLQWTAPYEHWVTLMTTI